MIEARGLARHYMIGRRVLHALDGNDLAVDRGATQGLVGESGSGKSTLGRTQVGL
ncbi:MAG: ATP-binding cassette domain-containing protein, partial [Parvibaculaceae bacterium]